MKRALGLIAVIAAGGGVVACGERAAAPAAPQANTAKVEKGELSALVSVDGTLTYRARPDGSPYTVINRARGTYTELPADGHKVRCGDVLYRVDDRPVLLLCGTVPAYRDLHAGDTGRDVRQLNRNLHVRGAGRTFTTQTKHALEALQRRRGLHVDGSLALGDAVFEPTPVRIAKVTGELGGPARPGAPVARATSGTLEVHVNLEASQDQVKRGDRAQITLPGNRSVTGRVVRLGRVAQAPASIGLDQPRRARGLDRAPVQVDITTKGVESTLSVPVTALVGRSGGGLAVEVVRAGGRRELVAVKPGLFDDTAGRVAVAGDLREGDAVVVPSL